MRQSERERRLAMLEAEAERPRERTARDADALIDDEVLGLAAYGLQTHRLGARSQGVFKSATYNEQVFWDRLGERLAELCPNGFIPIFREQIAPALERLHSGEWRVIETVRSDCYTWLNIDGAVDTPEDERARHRLCRAWLQVLRQAGTTGPVTTDDLIALLEGCHAAWLLAPLGGD